MAYRKSNYKNYKGKKSSRKGTYIDAEKLAGVLGLIEKGKMTPGTRIYDAYNRGKKGELGSRQTKPLA